MLLTGRPSSPAGLKLARRQDMPALRPEPASGEDEISWLATHRGSSGCGSKNGANDLAGEVFGFRLQPAAGHCHVLLDRLARFTDLLLGAGTSQRQSLGASLLRLETPRFERFENGNARLAQPVLIFLHLGFGQGYIGAGL